MSDSEQEERPRIKVTDRRLFDREGNVREDVESEREAPAKVADEEVPKVGPSPEAERPPARPEDPGPVRSGSPGETPSAAEPVAAKPSAPSEGGPAGGAPDADDRVDEQRLRAAMDADRESQGAIDTGGQSASELPRDFASFVESQYYETLLFLGAMRHPATGQTVEDLDMARYKIDLLSMLQEKTEGNRTPEESQLLEDVLYQLRMGYLQKRKVPKL